jgi:hypothetical protein
MGIPELYHDDFEGVDWGGVIPAKAGIQALSPERVLKNTPFTLRQAQGERGGIENC